GLYFSWSNMDEVHGDFQKKNVPLLSPGISLVNPAIVLDSIKKVHSIDAIVSIQLIEILRKPFYQVRCLSASHRESNHKHVIQEMIHLANAETGKLRAALTKEEAVEVAKMRFNGEPKVKSVDYLTSTNGHHEYRGNPLPAYAITFEHPSKTTVYVASELGIIQKFRNRKWRIFDFLWMMHTMDYENRDNFGNILLRIFSIFGLVTVLSGFLLFIISAKWNRGSKKSI
ncbi:MAG: hypothetical protein SFU20_12725, partial [Chitinophagaceae bacterium]|nr:hypothetical protein [Chitinophagaceae bacterium]